MDIFKKRLDAASGTGMGPQRGVPARAGGYLRLALLSGLLLWAPSPAGAFTPQNVVIAPNPLNIPCGGSANVNVTITGMVTAGDLIAGQVPVNLVDEDLFSDDLLATANWPVPARYTAGTVVTFTLTFTLSCTQACELTGSAGSSGEASADLAAEFATLGTNYGSATANCVKKPPATTSSVSCPDKIQAGEPLSFSALVYANSAKQARRATGAVTVKLITPTREFQVLGQTTFSDLFRSCILEGFLETGSLQPGCYRLAIITQDLVGRLLSEHYHDVVVE
ncbi:MAG: hypothetical protein HY320_12965 [Armatimonadetes bacterium]|nr:hypothetical protein [Armatimonadota bacterium]